MAKSSIASQKQQTKKKVAKDGSKRKTLSLAKTKKSKRPKTIPETTAAARVVDPEPGHDPSEKRAEAPGVFKAEEEEEKEEKEEEEEGEEGEEGEGDKQDDEESDAEEDAREQDDAPDADHVHAQDDAVADMEEEEEEDEYANSDEENIEESSAGLVEDDGFGKETYTTEGLYGNDSTPHPSTFIKDDPNYFRNIDVEKVRFSFYDKSQSIHNLPNAAWIQGPNQQKGHLRVVGPPFVVATSSMHPRGTFDNEKMRERIRNDPTKDENDMTNYSLQMFLSERAIVSSACTTRGMDPEVQAFHAWCQRVQERLVEFMVDEPRCMPQYKMELRSEFQQENPSAGEEEMRAFVLKRALRSKFRKTFMTPTDENKMPSGDRRFFSVGAPLFTSVYNEDKARGPSKFISHNPELMQKWDQGHKYNLVQVFDMSQNPVASLDPRTSTVEPGNIVAPVVALRTTFGQGKFGVKFTLKHAYKFGDFKVGAGSSEEKATRFIKSAQGHFASSSHPNVLEKDVKQVENWMDGGGGVTANQQGMLSISDEMINIVD